MSKSAKTIEQLKAEYAKMSEMSCKPDFERPRNGEVLDEDQSVRWNREQVEKQQKAYDEEVMRLNIKKNKARGAFYDDVKEYIKTNVKGISETAANEVFEYVYSLYSDESIDNMLRAMEDITGLISACVQSVFKKK